MLRTQNVVSIQKAAGATLGRTNATVLQRQCACGQHTGGGEQCEECKKEKTTLQRRSAARTGPATAPPIVHQVLGSPGRPLDQSTRAFMEPRFGYDFSGVQVHADARAASSAQAVNALAYTVGTNIVFGAGQYQPGTNFGQRILAHELAHVVQQRGHERALQGKAHPGAEIGVPQPADGPGGMVYDGSTLPVGQAADPLEREADSLSAAAISASQSRLPERVASASQMRRTPVPLIQRKMAINPTDTAPLKPGESGPPDLLTHAIQGLLGETCPSDQFQVDRATGNVTPKAPQFCQQPTPGPPAVTAGTSSIPVGCQCICDVVNDAQTTIIAFHAGGPGTSPRSVAGAGPGQGGSKTSPTVYADPHFEGQYLINGQWVDIPFHLIFAHELCGHALPKMQGTHAARSGVEPPGGTPDAEQHAVDVERQVAAEHNPPLPRRPEDYAGAARQKP